MLRETVLQRHGRQVVLLDSMSQARTDDRDRVLIAASNGGVESGRLAVLCGCAAAVFNDAGGGKERAGIAGLQLMDDAGVPGAAVGYLTARISDGRDTWDNGVLTYVNTAGLRAGLTVGDQVSIAVTRLLATLPAPAGDDPADGILPPQNGGTA